MKDTGIDDVFELLYGDCLERMKGLPDGSVNTCVTSPPYFGLRSYLPDTVKIKPDTPEWVKVKLQELMIFPIDTTTE